ncbi:C40 family peptidase [Carboxylicivirga linearis]|uniref:C40 family peptidase n=1 Tax=Carboxylicivirga linearis TaxID=1628157 RepID=A0ABS5K059_9BACT|nr:C40 family peptidase [Carboxylicivirga linearis]MBS2100460.1 C40 family peptidase [Carboxylicivirga linearis]
MVGRWGIIVLIGLFTVSCQVSGYELLLDKTIDPTLRQRIEDFASRGIEQEWPAEFTKEDLVQSALKYKGTTCKAGGMTSKGLDCSGLVYLAGKNIGLNLPHKSSDMARYGNVVSTKGRLRKGDLIFFKGNSIRLVNHVGIMINTSEFIHVSSSKGCVITSLDDEYWGERFLWGTR